MSNIVQFFSRHLKKWQNVIRKYGNIAKIQFKCFWTIYVIKSVSLDHDLIKSGSRYLKFKMMIDKKMEAKSNLYLRSVLNEVLCNTLFPLKKNTVYSKDIFIDLSSIFWRTDTRQNSWDHKTEPFLLFSYFLRNFIFLFFCDLNICVRCPLSSFLFSDF